MGGIFFGGSAPEAFIGKSGFTTQALCLYCHINFNLLLKRLIFFCTEICFLHVLYFHRWIHCLLYQTLLPKGTSFQPPMTCQAIFNFFNEKPVQRDLCFLITNIGMTCRSSSAPTTCHVCPFMTMRAYYTSMLIQAHQPDFTSLKQVHPIWRMCICVHL